MAERDILQIGDPRLKTKNRAVKNFDNPRVKKVVQDLIDTIHKNDLVGMAAPQIGENWRIFVTEPRETKFRTADQTDQLRVYINPRITYASSMETVIYEGCGCVAHGDLFAPVKRPKVIAVEAQDENMERFSLICDGLLGRVIQHENDHLSGVEFTEKIFDLRKIVGKDFYIKKIKTSPAQVKASIITIKQYSKV